MNRFSGIKFRENVFIVFLIVNVVSSIHLICISTGDADVVDDDDDDDDDDEEEEEGVDEDEEPPIVFWHLGKTLYMPFVLFYFQRRNRKNKIRMMKKVPKMIGCQGLS